MLKPKGRKVPVECTCEVCGEKWMESRLGRLSRACSKDCKSVLMSRAHARRAAEAGRTTKPRVKEIVCRLCGKAVTLTKHAMLNQHSTCSRACAAEIRLRAILGISQPSTGAFAPEVRGYTKTGEPFVVAPYYFILSPQREAYTFQDMAAFVADHRAELLSRRYEDTHIRHTVRQVETGLGRLAPWASRRIDSWNGWTWDHAAAEAAAAQAGAQSAGGSEATEGSAMPEGPAVPQDVVVSEDSGMRE